MSTSPKTPAKNAGKSQAARDIHIEMESLRLGTKKNGEFELFGPEIYSSADKMRSLLTAYSGMAVRKSVTMNISNLENELEHHYKRLVNAFNKGYCKCMCVLQVHACLFVYCVLIFVYFCLYVCMCSTVPGLRNRAHVFNKQMLEAADRRENVEEVQGG